MKNKGTTLHHVTRLSLSRLLVVGQHNMIYSLLQADVWNFGLQKSQWTPDLDCTKCYEHVTVFLYPIPKMFTLYLITGAYPLAHTSFGGWSSIGYTHPQTWRILIIANSSKSVDFVLSVTNGLSFRRYGEGRFFQEMNFLFVGPIYCIVIVKKGVGANQFTM